MCGIAGIVSFRGRVDAELLLAMNAMLVHRGPDDGGEWTSSDERAGLANRRLAILDLTPAGHQPMLTADASLAIAFNGEIYNYVELRDELAGRGRTFRTHTDTEVILEAYAEWGPQCVERFNGMFAFAIWDAAKRQLFAARDRFGEKPFYYHHSAERFVFASELKALFRDPEVPRTPDMGVVARYLQRAQLDGTAHTFFAGIRQLEPAQTLILTAAGELTTRRYWELSINQPPPPIDLPLAAERFRELLFDSIRLRLRSDVAVGSSLSGGLDSSSIVCAVQAMRDGTAGQNTFSARYRGNGPDEGRFIESVVQRTGVSSHHVFIEGDRVIDDLDRFLWFQDEPVAHTSQYAQWKVMELARDVGITVLLDGQGADEIIGGYPSPTYGYRYAEMARTGKLAQLVSELAAFRSHHGSVAPALRYMGAALMPDGLRRFARARAHGTGGLAIPGVEQPNGWQPPADAGYAPPLRRALYETLTFTSLPSLLRYGDRNSMAFSREARLPFLDHRLVEFAYTLPPAALVRGGISKVVLRDAMNGVIPDVVRLRSDKIGFATPEREWLAGPLRPWLQERLAGLRRRGLLDVKTIDAQWRAFERGGRSGNVWRLANLEAWFDTFIDRSPAARP